MDQIGSLADDEMPDPDQIRIRFQGQDGYDAGGLTDDWLSMFMLEAMNPFRRPPLFLLPKQIDGMKEACCLRLNHSLHAFGITADRERAMLRAFGFVLAVCLKRGRFACNRCMPPLTRCIFAFAADIMLMFCFNVSLSYMLSKSLLQRLLGQDLPGGLLGLKEEFPEEYQVRCIACVRKTCFVLAFLPLLQVTCHQALEDLRKHPEYLQLADKKYTACSRISDLYDLQRYLNDCIERAEKQIDLEQTKMPAEPASPSSSRDRVGLREQLINEVVVQSHASGIDSIKAIKTAFFHRNEALPKEAQFHFVNSEEIRSKLRELRGEAVFSRVQPEGERVAALQASIAHQRQLMQTLHAGELELRRLRDEHSKLAADSDATESIVKDVPPSTDVTALNFEEYCADVVQKRLHDDIAPMLQCMMQGFMSVYGPGEYEALKLMNVSDVQHKLFPLDPVTVETFRKNARMREGANAKLMWKVMHEELSLEQVQNVFYFATNWHTLNGAQRKVEISFQSDTSVPIAATCSWSLVMPDCFAGKGDSRQKMREGVLLRG